MAGSGDGSADGSGTEREHRGNLVADDCSPPNALGPASIGLPEVTDEEDEAHRLARGETERLEQAWEALEGAVQCEGLPTHARAALRVAADLLAHYVAHPPVSKVRQGPQGGTSALRPAPL